MSDSDAAVAELNAFGIPGVRYVRETLSKCGIAATHLKVIVDGHEEASFDKDTEADDLAAFARTKGIALSEAKELLGTIQKAPNAKTRAAIGPVPD